MKYKSITISKKVSPCGHIHCIFLEEEGVFHRLFIKGAMTRETPCGEAFLDPIAKILTYAMRRGLWEKNIEKGIVKQLLNVRCNSTIPNKEHICSCSDAIGKSVKEYIEMKGIKDEV